MDFNIEEELKKLPKSPGVYLMHGGDDSIIYIGKAVNLFNRVHSYFRKTNKSAKILRMVDQIRYFEYIVTDSELEALVLECNLIKEHRPRYNTMLKDDKTYPYIKVTVAEEYPRLLFSRQMKKDKAKYFGPYTSAGSVRDTIELVSRIFRLRTCSRVLPKDQGKERVCLNYHIHQCMGPCREDFGDKEAYTQAVRGALDFLNGSYAPILKMLKEKMEKASEEMRFEDAAGYRDLMESVKAVAEKQKITSSGGEDRDVIALSRGEQEIGERENEDSGLIDVVVQVFFIRDGRLIGRDHFFMNHINAASDAEILNDFVKQFYSGTPFIPKEIMMECEIEDRELLEEYLSGKKGSRVSVTVPLRGQKERMIELAKKNAELILSNNRERIRREEGRTIGAAKEIAQLLGLPNADRMESYDISHISGFDSVGSMVVFERGKAKHSDYRKFRIRSGVGNDDYASMKEVLTRRFTHHSTDNEYDAFNRLPDLILMDGGRGQVNIALEVLSSLEINIPVAGLVKDDNHRTRGIWYGNEELPVDSRSEGFKLMTRIQDEVHRFAIEYHRSLRSVHQVHSILDDIEGIGPARRKALMRKFGSVEAIRAASLEELAAIPEMTEKAARAVKDFFAQPDHSET
ncbi:MAG: excinuclease ABC subunit UvrC [Lachnospiraceae bacterium]|nr:excinuclease ABC subunit UvrC [Lachnospiraceae bacterium]